MTVLQNHRFNLLMAKRIVAQWLSLAMYIATAIVVGIVFQSVTYSFIDRKTILFEIIENDDDFGAIRNPYYATMVYFDGNEVNSDYKTWKQRGLANYIGADYTMATRDFTNALMEDKSDASLYYMRSKAYMHDFQLDLAVSDCDFALEYAHTDQIALFSDYCGRIHYLLGDLSGAMRLFSIAIHHDDLRVSAHHLRGIIFFRMSDYGMAEAEFSKVIMLDNENGSAYFMRSQVYRHLHDWSAMLKDLQRYNVLVPDDGDGFYNRYVAEENLGLYLEAAESLDKYSRLGLYANRAWIRERIAILTELSRR